MFKAFLVLLLFLVIFSSISGCAPTQGPTNSPASDNRGVNLPPMPAPDKGNPKLSTFLNQLILAEKQGEAEPFARQRNVKLVDGKVRVEIEAMPGQLDTAARAAAAVGTVEVISRTLNMMSSVVPITSLTALAEEESIHFIREPISPTLDR